MWKDANRTFVQEPFENKRKCELGNVENANRTFAPKPFENKHFWRVEIWESLGNDNLAGNPSLINS